MKVIIDGRVLTHKFTTGVQRYTRELLKAFDEIGFTYQLSYPKSNNRYLQHLWEHFVLPHKAKDYNLLFCPGNIAPVWKYKRVKLVTTIHSLSFSHAGYTKFFSAYYKLIIPRVVEISDKIITVSNTEKDNIVKHFPKYENKIVSIPNGISDIFLNQKTTFEKDDFILYVGSLNPTKNFQGVIKAFLQISNKVQHRLIIVGPMLSIYKKIYNPISEKIVFLGVVEDTQLIELYRKASLFVFPSFYESFGLPPLEAMACGCPVLVSHIPSLVETCGDAAVYCNPYDIEDISRKMLYLIKDEKLRKELIKKGLQRVKLFSWRKTAEETINVFKQIL